ncbi:hypothetical protein [Kocuria tytonis]|uniref:Uncharacterized protein n=1 Tax=Kocuria tytonis TaxID=2054280 RepID=A0A495AC68_9MICC|nr:hypothetical protein [Kocuria tytonis]RKQ36225.1 hypothetical protein C1C97_000620 [Kocuria tytonis]
MTDYQPQRGERAVLYGSAVNSIEVLVADYRCKFAPVGRFNTRMLGLGWNPVLAHGQGDVRPLDADTREWSWDTLMEAKRRHEAGEPLAPLATHRLVKNTGNTGMHLEPIEEEASCSPLF